MKEQIDDGQKFKFCRDCKYNKTVDHGYAIWWYCTNPDLVKTCVVSGEVYYTHCETERNTDGRCKPKGIYYKPKPATPRLEVITPTIPVYQSLAADTKHLEKSRNKRSIWAKIKEFFCAQ